MISELPNKFKNQEEKRAYYQRNFKSLNPFGHQVASGGQAQTLERERPDGARRYALDPDINKIVTQLSTDNLFWGDITQSKEINNYRLRVLMGMNAHEFREKKEQEKIMSLHSLIANGGKIVVIGGRMNPSWGRWEKDPRILFWTGDRSEIERNFSRSGDIFPSNTHGVILSRFLSHATSSQVLEEAKRRRMTVMGPKNDGEVTRMLEEITTVPPPNQSTPAPAPKQEQPGLMRPTVKGELLEYAKKYDDATKTIREMGAVIFNKMKEAGIQTTQSSVEQSIGNMRRSAGVFANPKLVKSWRQTSEEATQPPGVPEMPKPFPPPPPPTSPPPLPVDAAPAPRSMASAVPPPEGMLILLKMIDDLAAGLSLMKEEVKKMHEQNAEYRALEAKLAELGFIRK